MVSSQSLFPSSHTKRTELWSAIDLFLLPHLFHWFTLTQVSHNIYFSSSLNCFWHKASLKDGYLHCLLHFCRSFSHSHPPSLSLSVTVASSEDTGKYSNWDRWTDPGSAGRRHPPLPPQPGHQHQTHHHQSRSHDIVDWSCDVIVSHVILLSEFVLDISQVMSCDANIDTGRLNGLFSIIQCGHNTVSKYTPTKNFEMFVNHLPSTLCLRF